MRIELKNFKYADFASDETPCFTATVYVNGKRSFTVENDGHGGPNNYHNIDSGEGYKAVEEYAASLFEVDVDGTGKYFIQPNVETVIFQQVDKILNERETKKILRRISYIKDGAIYQLSAKWKPTDENLRKVKTASWWKSGYRLLNELPFDEAHRLIHKIAA